MIENRSIPRCTVIPEFPYRDVKEAASWLCDVFGFSLRIDIGSHRAQLNVGDGAVVLTELGRGRSFAGAAPGRKVSVMVRVPDVYQPHERVRQRGARVVRPPTDDPYGERQYSVEISPATSGRLRNRLRPEAGGLGRRVGTALNCPE